MTTAYNIDCMEYMKSLPDNAFDLAVCDPPYGGVILNKPTPDKPEPASEGTSTSISRTGGTWAAKYGKKL